MTTKELARSKKRCPACRAKLTSTNIATSSTFEIRYVTGYTQIKTYACACGAQLYTENIPMQEAPA